MTEIARQIANDLLEINAVTLSPKEPFTWASGIQAPIYTDNRRTIAFPAVRTHIADGLATYIKANFPEATVIAGVAGAELTEKTYSHTSVSSCIHKLSRYEFL